MRLVRKIRAHDVFVPEIDEEHRLICQTAREFQQAIESNASRLQMLEILHRLIGLAQTHFAHEEALMRTHRYSLREWHAQQHDTVRKKVRRFAPLVEADDREAAREFCAFLSAWVDDHTAVADRMMGAFIRNQRRSSHAA